MSRNPRFLFLFIALLLSPACPAGTAAWLPLGPYGGDVRALASEPGAPSHLFLGTSNSQIYMSTDGGRSWKWWSEISPRPDYVVDHLIVDGANPAVMFAAVWSTEVNGGGGVFKSVDGGRRWTMLSRVGGESVRSLAQWKADPRVLVAGTLTGVFRTRDAGRSWERISPFNHEEIRSIESVSIDPRDANMIYAGTWHLAWKTADGGATWNSIKTGMIDDSDVFSIQPDWSSPDRIYASACSGIYRSENGGSLWRKIQGIPHSARRTRVIRLDPVNPLVVYAGTTEGLWRTESGGDSWVRLTSPTLIVNDIFVDPLEPQRLVLATDRAGVMMSTDGGATFELSNQGFAHRQVSRTVFDPASNRLYVAVLNDKEYGGVFVSEGHAAWRQVAKGLEGRDVFALIYAQGANGNPDGYPSGSRLLAGTSDGVMALDAQNETWVRVGRLKAAPTPELPGSDRTPYSQVLRSAQAQKAQSGAQPGAQQVSPGSPKSKPAKPKAKAARSSRGAPPARPPAALPAVSGPSSGDFKSPVNDLFQAGPSEPLYAATNHGVFRSTDAGDTWQRLSPPMPASTVVSEGKTIMIGVPGGLEVSMNGGSIWFHLYLPTSRLYTHINAIALSGKTILVGSDAGLFRSTDSGGNWDRKGNGVPYNVPITSVRMMPGDATRVFAVSPASGRVYVSRDSANTFEAFEEIGFTGRTPRSLALVARKNALELVVSSAFDGLFYRSLDGDIVGAPRSLDRGQ